ncbi:helix-turn-helix domain-containing protein [Anaerotignum sp.]
MKKTGELLSRLRKEKGMTQKQAAEWLQVSDRTISKWERGMGLPDVSLWKGISALYGVEIEKILDGELQEKGRETGNMKRMKFYCCEHCGNIFWSMGGGEISCCGRKLSPLQAKAAEDGHEIRVEEVGNEYYITFPHVMKKEHYISFAALVSWDRVTLVRLYPEQAAEVYLPRQRRGEVYYCCSEHGLFRKKL